MRLAFFSVGLFRFNTVTSESRWEKPPGLPDVLEAESDGGSDVSVGSVGSAPPDGLRDPAQEPAGDVGPHAGNSTSGVSSVAHSTHLCQHPT